MHQHGFWEIDLSQHLLGMGIQPIQLGVSGCGRDPINAVSVRSDEIGTWSNPNVEPVQLPDLPPLRQEINFPQNAEVHVRAVEKHPHLRLCHV
jgi:hypothetical protein